MYVCEIRKRRYRGKSPPQIRGPEDAYRFLRKQLEGKDREHFVVILLSSKNAVIGVETVSVGTLNASIVHPREVFKPAVVNSAAAILLLHNHPSGIPTPSQEDIAITKRIKKAGEVLGIDVLDHVIVGKGTYQSLKELGVM